MSLSETEKRALRQKQKLAYSSGQFPLRAQRKRPMKLSSMLLVLGIVVGGLIALVAVALWMRG